MFPTLTALLLLVLLPAASLAQPPDEIPLEDILQVLAIDRKLIALDARSGARRVLELRLAERLVWHGSRGKVGMAFTDQRILAVAQGSAAWQQVPIHAGEVLPAAALLGDRVGLVVTSRRALGFDGGTGNVVESSLGLRERVIAQRVGANVGVVVTNRRALGVSPQAGGFFTTSMNVEERFEELSVDSNIATVITNRRLLIFRGPFGSWSETRRNLR
jgi:hypothetical protein